MAAKAFNLAEHLAAVAPVSNLDTPKISLLPVRKVFPNENNFYDTTNIDELVNSILMYGLLDPITVRPSGDGEGYVIISGHRRHRAVAKILDEQLAEDITRFESIPCIIREPKDELLEELMLIQANSATRVLTSAELGKQAERVERLLCELKEQGYEFPGRMRDNVASACQVSASKLARLKVIREKLVSEYAQYYEAGKLNESVAYALAQLPCGDQTTLFKLRAAAYKGDNGKGVKHLAEWKVRDYKKAKLNAGKIKCSCGCSRCINADSKIARMFSKEYCYDGCDKICCSACPRLASCKFSCSLLTRQKAELKVKEKEARNEEKQAEKRKNDANEAMRREIWTHFAKARARAGLSVKEAREAQGDYYSSWMDDDYRKYESGEAEGASTMLPLPLTLGDIRNIVALADRLDCSVDYLLCRSNELRPSSTALTWREGLPERSGWYAATFDCEGIEIRDLAWYDNCLGKFYFDEPCTRSIEATCSGWYPIPEGD